MQPFDIEDFLKNALAEDIGQGDITSDCTVPEGATARFVFQNRQPAVIAGLELIPQLYALIDPMVQVNLLVKDGVLLDTNTRLAIIEGPARALLMGERVSLNLLQHLCGIATLTRSYVDAVAGIHVSICDTRKTIPGLRVLQKYAVRMGGGMNHRMGLYDGILIKDNHLALAGSVTQAVNAAKAVSALPVQVECDSLEQVNEALAAGADMLLLDNMDSVTLKEAVLRARKNNIVTEASGNVNLDTIRAIAEAGVDRISIGRLTHSAPAIDIGLDAL